MAKYTHDNSDYIKDRIQIGRVMPTHTTNVVIITVDNATDMYVNQVYKSCQTGEDFRVSFVMVNDVLMIRSLYKEDIREINVGDTFYLISNGGQIGRET